MKKIFLLFFLTIFFSIQAYEDDKVTQAIMRGLSRETWKEFSYEEIGKIQDGKQDDHYYRLRIKDLPPNTAFDICCIDLHYRYLPPKACASGYINQAGEAMLCSDDKEIHLADFVIDISNTDPGEPVYYLLVTKDKKIYRAVSIVSNQLEIRGDNGERISVEYLNPERNLCSIRGFNFKPDESYTVNSKALKETRSVKVSKDGYFHCPFGSLNIDSVKDEISIISDSSKKTLIVPIQWGKLPTFTSSEIFKDAFLKYLKSETKHIFWSEVVSRVKCMLNQGIDPEDLKKNGQFGPFALHLAKGALPVGDEFDCFQSNVSGEPALLCSGYIGEDGEAYIKGSNRVKISDHYLVIGQVYPGEPMLDYIVTKDKSKCFVTYVIAKELSAKGKNGEKVSLFFIDGNRSIYIVSGENFKANEKVLLCSSLPDGKSEMGEVMVSDKGEFFYMLMNGTALATKTLEVKTKSMDAPVVIKYGVGRGNNE